MSTACPLGQLVRNRVPVGGERSATSGLWAGDRTSRSQGGRGSGPRGTGPRPRCRCPRESIRRAERYWERQSPSRTPPSCRPGARTRRGSRLGKGLRQSPSRGPISRELAGATPSNSLGSCLPESKRPRTCRPHSLRGTDGSRTSSTGRLGPADGDSRTGDATVGDPRRFQARQKP